MKGMGWPKRKSWEKTIKGETWSKRGQPNLKGPTVTLDETMVKGSCDFMGRSPTR